MRIKLFLFFLIFSLTSTAQSNYYDIRFKLKNSCDSIAYLANYYDGKVFSIDTSVINNNEFIFTQNKRLASGIYIVYLPSKSYFEIFIGSNQIINISADIENKNALKIKGAKESIIYNKFQLYMNNKNSEREALSKKTHKSNLSSRKDIEKINKEISNYIDSLSCLLPNSSLSYFLKFAKEIEIPDFNSILDKDISNRKDSINILSYNYYKLHYWDNAQLNDSTILLSPIFKPRIDNYFRNVLIQNPDSISNEAIKLIESARANKTMFKYITSYCYNYSLNSKIMGMDRAYYNIATKYYLNNDVYWIEDSTKLKIRDKINRLKYNLIGCKAKDIKLKNIDNEIVSLYNTDASLCLLVFWEPNCGHCEKEMPLLKTEILDKFANKGLKIFAVNIKNKLDSWQEFINKHDLHDFINCYDPTNISQYKMFYDIVSTPKIFLLDKNKIIIAKDINIANYHNIIESRLD